MKKTTPVPNVIFDCYLKELRGIELKILLVIIRQTLGWADQKSSLGRKVRDWISGSQLRQKTGGSPRAISSAVENLASRNFIEVFDATGRLLDSPLKRRGKPRLYYKLSAPVVFGVENPGISCKAKAKFAEDFSKKVSELVQKMQITK
jgi:hypothetical protein